MQLQRVRVNMPEIEGRLRTRRGMVNEPGRGISRRPDAQVEKQAGSTAAPSAWHKTHFLVWYSDYA